jgi:predicted regulator of Ras-like GTPase activity (Roadblock/LC7/MglB family)
MRDMLHNINKVQGVIGSLIRSDDGSRELHVFPPVFEGTTLMKMTSAISDTIRQLDNAGSLELLDMRYQEGRIIAKKLKGGFLALLCSNDINMSLLTISLNVAKPKMEILLAEAATTTLSPEEARKIEEHLDKMKIAFIRQIGPVGEIVFNDAVKRMGASGLTSDDELVELVELLKGEIDNIVSRTEFINEAIAIIG